MSGKIDLAKIKSRYSIELVREDYTGQNPVHDPMRSLLYFEITVDGEKLRTSTIINGPSGWADDFLNGATLAEIKER